MVGSRVYCVCFECVIWIQLNWVRRWMQGEGSGEEGGGKSMLRLGSWKVT